MLDARVEVLVEVAHNPQRLHLRSADGEGYDVGGLSIGKVDSVGILPQKVSYSQTK